MAGVLVKVAQTTLPAAPPRQGGQGCDTPDAQADQEQGGSGHETGQEKVTVGQETDLRSPAASYSQE